jgi:hypothetical protein
MTRQRMYLFERAYVDYSARFRRYGNGVLGAIRNTWDWFWSGLGSKIIEVIISILLSLAAIGACVFYVRYEISKGRGFSWSMVFVIAIIFGVTLALLFGWKAFLHFLARLVSGLLATSVIVVFGLGALLIALAFFSIYLVVLLLLTALSFLVFLPMRGMQELWLLYRRVAYRCPYDDCPGKGLPIHVCSCGHEYDDLLPSFYGIFHHTCRHPDKDVKLATLDMLGRNRLPRLCSTCHRPLILSSIGELSEKPIAVIGGPSAGKTVFLRQAIRQLRQHLGAFPRAVVKIDSPEQELVLNQDLALLDRGQVVAKTGGEVIQAFGLAIKIPKKMHSLLYLFDAPGEHFATMSRFGSKQVIQHLKGIVLMVDPFSLPGLSDYAANQMGASETPFKEIVAVLVAGVNQMLVSRTTDLCTVPLAVVIAKADALPVDDYAFLRGLVSGDGNPHSPELSGRCRQALVSLGEGGSVRALETKFSNVQYYACSALGRSPDFRATQPFQPSGVLEPLMWMLGIA